MLSRYIQKTRIKYNKSAKSGMMNGPKRSGGNQSLHKIYMLQTLCTTKRAVSTFGRENRFRRSMGMILIQSMERDVLRIQLKLKRFFFFKKDRFLQRKTRNNSQYLIFLGRCKSILIEGTRETPCTMLYT